MVVYKPFAQQPMKNKTPALGFEPRHPEGNEGSRNKFEPRAIPDYATPASVYPEFLFFLKMMKKNCRGRDSHQIFKKYLVETGGFHFVQAH